MDKHDLVGKHFLLQHLSHEERAEMLKFVQVRHYAAGEVIFQKGDPGDALMGVNSGRVKISAVSVSGREIVLDIIEAGQIFGEIAVIDGESRSADASAMTPTELLVIRRRDLLHFIEENSGVSTRLLMVLCSKMRKSSQRIEDSVFLGVAGRLAKTLLLFAEIYGVETENGTCIDLNLTQGELGNFIGASRERVNRQLRQWEDTGVISVDQSRFIILDHEALKLIAEGD